MTQPLCNPDSIRYKISYGFGVPDGFDYLFCGIIANYQFCEQGRGEPDVETIKRRMVDEYSKSTAQQYGE